MDFREGLERIAKICNDQNSCDGCPLDSQAGCVLAGSLPSKKVIDKICKMAEQEEQSIENAQLYVMKHLDDRAKLEQLAEEAAELSQAALKLIRADGLSKNITPITEQEALSNVREEIIDVLMCVKACGFKFDDVGVMEVMENSPKWLRWAERLKGETKQWTRT